MLHLDPTALDFNMLTRFFKTHRLHSATYRIYVEGTRIRGHLLEIALDACHEGVDVRHRGGQGVVVCSLLFKRDSRFRLGHLSTLLLLSYGFYFVKNVLVLMRNIPTYRCYLVLMRKLP